MNHHRANNQINPFQGLLQGNLWPCLILLLTCLITHLSAIHNQFQLDDWDFFGSYYQHFFPTFKDLFIKTASQHYSPFYYLVNIWLFKLSPSSPVPGHLLNLGLFFTNAVLTFYFIGEITKQRAVGFWTAILFILHPANGETISYITMNFMQIFYGSMIASLWAFWRNNTNPTKSAFAISIFCFIVALLNFEAALLLPLYLLSLQVFLLKTGLKKALKKCVPYFVLAVVYLGLWMSVAQPNTGILDKAAHLNLSIAVYLATITYLISWYTGNLFYPNELILMKNMPPIVGLAWFWVLWGIALSAGTAVLYRFWNNDPLKKVALTWFLGDFLLIFPASFAHAYMQSLVVEPHWFYFSRTGFILLLVLLFLDLKEHLGKKYRNLSVAGICLFLFLNTQFYHSVSKTATSYCEHWLRYSPMNSIALTALGREANSPDGQKKRLLYYWQALEATEDRFWPHYTHNNLAMIFIEQGNFRAAEEHIRRSIQYDPAYFGSYNILGNVLAAQGNYPEAEKSFLKALEIYPKYTSARLNLIDLYLMENKYDEAIASIDSLLNEDPESPENKNLLIKKAGILIKLGKETDAKKILDGSLAGAENPEPYIYIAFALHIMQLDDISLEYLKQGLKKFPDDEKMYQYVGNALMLKGDLEGSRNVLEKGLRKFPGDETLKAMIAQLKQ